MEQWHLGMAVGWVSVLLHDLLKDRSDEREARPGNGSERESDTNNQGIHSSTPITGSKIDKIVYPVLVPLSGHPTEQIERNGSSFI